MINILEICRRAQTGPKMTAESFDLDVVFANARKLTQKYAIAYDP